MTDDVVRQAEAFEQLERLEDPDDTLDLELLADGRIRAQKAAARELLRDRLRSAEVLPTGPEWAVLRSRSFVPPRELLGRPREVVAAGTLGGQGWSIVDVVGFISSGSQTGVLSVRADARRSVYFYQGDVVWASSTSTLDRLGAFLLGRGKITRDQLHAALRDGPAGIGRASVERGYLEQRELEELVRAFIGERFEDLVRTTGGLWSFARLSEEPLMEAPLRLHTQGLLVDTLRRLDEMLVYRQRIHSSEVLVRQTREPLEDLRNQLQSQCPQLAEESEVVLRALSGGAKVQDLMRRTGLGEFEITRAVYHLLRANVVRLEARPRRPSRSVRPGADPREVVNIYGLALTEMVTELRRTGRTDEMLESVNLFLQEEGGAYRELLSELRLDGEGRLDTSAVLARFEASGASPDELIDALGELLFFALLRAAEILGRRRGDDLARRVRLIHGMLRRPEERR